MNVKHIAKPETNKECLPLLLLIYYSCVTVRSEPYQSLKDRSKSSAPKGSLLPQWQLFQPCLPTLAKSIMPECC